MLYPTLRLSASGSINAKPGFTEESLKSLKLKYDSTSKPVVCLRKQKMFKQKKLGYMNFGKSPVEGREEVLATQVLVFMLVSMTENWKIPVGYFLTAGISADT